MTPKEQAKELVSKCYNSLLLWSEQDNAKQCALIAVNEILKETNQLIPKQIHTLDGLGVDMVLNPRFNYWQEVKNEIELL